MSGPETASVPLERAEGLSQLTDALLDMGIVGTHTEIRMQRLAGGVSSDAYRVDLPHRVVCVKRALAKLNVAADWRAPVERNHYEAEWLREAARAVPGSVPDVLGESLRYGAFAMTWLPPDRYPVWKTQLSEGTVDRAVATRVGMVLGRIHSATADRADLAAKFATDAMFHAIRLEPYLLATAQAHPDLREELHELAATTAATRRVLVHGDYSPKNLLVGPEGPIVLDAECAWFGDPAFDLAFLLNHLLLKCAWHPRWRERYLQCFDAATRAYGRHVDWEDPGALEARTARLLPGLLLARIDGKSPVEYVGESQRNRVRLFARRWLQWPPRSLQAICEAARADAAFAPDDEEHS